MPESWCSHRPVVICGPCIEKHCSSLIRWIIILFFFSFHSTLNFTLLILYQLNLEPVPVAKALNIQVSCQFGSSCFLFLCWIPQRLPVCLLEVEKNVRWQLLHETVNDFNILWIIHLVCIPNMFNLNMVSVEAINLVHYCHLICLKLTKIFQL